MTEAATAGRAKVEISSACQRARPSSAAPRLGSCDADELRWIDQVEQ